MRESFSIFLLELEIYCHGRFQTLNKLTRFFAHSVIYFWNILPNKIKKRSIKYFKMKLDDFRNNVKKKNLCRRFCELSDESPKRI